MQYVSKVSMGIMVIIWYKQLPLDLDLRFTSGNSKN